MLPLREFSPNPKQLLMKILKIKVMNYYGASRKVILNLFDFKSLIVHNYIQCVRTFESMIFVNIYFLQKACRIVLGFT